MASPTKKNLSTPKALFDTLENFEEKNLAVLNYLETLQIENISQEYQLCLEFLASYAGSNDTFIAYRREVERLCHFAWLVAKKSLKQLDRNDIRHYIDFINKPPASWIGTQNLTRFIQRDGVRIQNPRWRPFVVRLPKAQFKAGDQPKYESYRLTNNSRAAVFAVMSTFFTYLMQENYVSANPVQLIRQKSRYIQKTQKLKITRKLSQLQWQYVIETIKALTASQPDFERHLFILSTFYLLGLRISEISEKPERIPIMGDFAPDKTGRWWFSTVGKGNKLRDVAVPDEMLEALKRYRASLNLSPLPAREENIPLIHKQRGQGGLGTRQVRNLIQQCFDIAINKLKAAGEIDEANDLAHATVHWLRHTAISADVTHRPITDVRDDAGHSNSRITDIYIDTDRIARHDSAKHKALIPQINKVKETNHA